MPQVEGHKKAQTRSGFVLSVNIEVLLATLQQQLIQTNDLLFLS